MDPTTLVSAGANPFAAFTFIAAPALLTNASSVLLLGTSNRLARSVDRVRALATHLDHHTDIESRIAQLELKQMQSAEMRVRIIVRALTCFYLAVGSFAFGTAAALLGATIAWPLHISNLQWSLWLTVTACLVGVGSIMAGAFSLVIESRLTFRILQVEADLVRERYAHVRVA